MSVDSNLNRLLKNSAALLVSRFVFRLVFPFLGGLRVAGIENIPASGGVILCPNHTANLDPVAVCAATIRPDLNALAKSEFFQIPVLGAYFRAIGALPVVRDSPDRAALRTAESILNAGRMLLIFPEGKCSRSGLLQDLHPGAIMLSQRSGAPIVPVAIRGANKVLPYTSVLPRFVGGGVTVTFGEPIEPAQYSGEVHRAAQRRMTDDLRSALLNLTGQS